jgi:ribonuclease HII
MLEPFLHKTIIEAGIDEAGRGCYAGPVYAAAVILPKDFYHPLLNDSKKLSEKQRELLRPVIEKESIAFAIGVIDNDDIDRINILQASFKAMHMAVNGLKEKPQHLLVDGNRFKSYKNIDHTCIVKGDGKYASIAAASVLAKTHRDDYMHSIHAQYQQYAWDRNKGYGTYSHRKAIAAYGLCEYHRKSFNIL